MHKIIIINGPGGAGKDTFIRYCEETNKYKILNISTVDKVKEIAANLGWTWTKRPEDRTALSNLKDMLTLWNDVPFKHTVSRIEQQIYEWEQESCDGIIFVHCREPHEIQRFVDWGADNNYKVISLLVTRDTQERYTNHADLNVYDYCYDYLIDNNDSLFELRQQANIFIENV